MFNSSGCLSKTYARARVNKNIQRGQGHPLRVGCHPQVRHTPWGHHAPRPPARHQGRTAAYCGGIGIPPSGGIPPFIA